MDAPDQQVITGRLKFPPSLGFNKGSDGMVARLANTLETAGGSLTIVFGGERAEIAERLLRAGGRVDVEGVLDPASGHFEVDRFDVDGSVGTHSYGIGDVDHGQEIVALDTSSAASTTDQPLATVTSIAERQRSGPNAPSPGSNPPVGAEPTPVAGHPDGGGFEVGQRVRARDRGNLGTIVGIDTLGDELRHYVKFVSGAGTEATVPFIADQIEPAPQRSRGPRQTQGSVAPSSQHAALEPETRATAERWEFHSLPDGTARLALPTSPPHEIRISRGVEDSDTHPLWVAEVLWVDDDGEAAAVNLVDGRRSQLVVRSLATLADLPSFQPHRSDPRWTNLLASVAPDGLTVGDAAPPTPTRWAGQDRGRDSGGVASVDGADVDGTSQYHDHESPSGPDEARPSQPVATEEGSEQAVDSPRPALRILSVHTRAVDPQTGAISI